MNGRKVLLLNASMNPIGEISKRKAILLALVRKKAEVLEYFDDNEFNLAVVKLNQYSPYAERANRIFCKKKVFIRDQFTCQYCSKQCTSDATIDHVLPRSRGGKSTYDNCVTCCFKCNQRKQNYLISEIGFKLLKDSYKLDSALIVDRRKIPKEWAPYIDYLF